MSEYIYSENDVRKMWQRSYSEQIGVAQAKCLEAIVRTDGKLEVSFSGGKDSAVLLYLMAEMWSSSSHKDEPLFHNAICNVQSWFYNLLSTALSVIEGICAALNKLPFVEFDYSGISSAADDYAAKASEAAGNKEDYQSISDAFNEGFTTFNAFQDGWASDAFNAGAAWGDGIADKVSNFSLSDVFGQTDIPNVGDYTSGFNDAIANSGVGDSIGNIDDNTGKIKDSLEVSEEDLKYLRDIAEQEAINRFTTAEINVDMSGMQNTVNSGDDIDGFMTKLTDSVNEAVDNMTEGVHE